MGRPREDRRVVTYSLGSMTLSRIEELRDHKKRSIPNRPTRVTMSEIIDDAIRHESARVFDDPHRGDPTKGGRWDPGLVGKAPMWKCPECIEERTDEHGVTAMNQGAFIVCPHCNAPRDPAL